METNRSLDKITMLHCNWMVVKVHDEVFSSINTLT